MVEYFSQPAVPGKAYFRCERYRATLSTESCAGMWRESNHDGLEHRDRCRCCALGAEHAGEAGANLAALKGTLTCGRCHRPAMRLIKGHLCVSCKNREYEWIKGRNAKGSRPVHMTPLSPRRLYFREGEATRTLSMPLVADIDELIVAALRDSGKRVQFAFRAASEARQKRLF